MQINYEELLKPYFSLFSGSRNPVVYLNSDFVCVKETGGVMAVGENLISYLREPVTNPVANLTEVILYKNDYFYCCRIMPVRNNTGKIEAYICELVDSESARIISERADCASDILPLYNSVEYNSTVIWKSAEKLRSQLQENGDFKVLSEVLQIELAMSEIISVWSNAYEYMNMQYSSQNKTVIDAGGLCRALAERCNAALAKCGRRIDTIIEPESLFIYADSRRTIAALVNAVQNALLYSPRDSEPILAVYRTEKDGKAYVEIRLTNENIMFTSQDFKERFDINFCNQRLGFGIPLIKRFAKICGGIFSMTDENGKVVVTISLPEASDYSGAGVLNSSYFTDYSTGVPDFVEVKMLEVVHFFGEVL